VIVSVKDEGIGIPEKDLQHIFEPFFRASNTGKFDGHGVGLPLALNIIRLHKGSIAILSKENEGTEGDAAGACGVLCSLFIIRKKIKF
jgi:signal transduction histidine kinase